MNNAYEIKKVILGNHVFVSDNWVSNASFAIKKEKIHNVEDFKSEEIFSLLSTYKGMNSDFSKVDEDFEKLFSGDFTNKYEITSVSIRKDKKYYTVFKSESEDYILIDSTYVDYFDLEVLYGETDNSLIFVNHPEKVDFFVADVETVYDKEIVQKYVDFGKKAIENSKMNKFFK